MRKNCENLVTPGIEWKEIATPLPDWKIDLHLTKSKNKEQEEKKIKPPF